MQQPVEDEGLPVDGSHDSSSPSVLTDDMPRAVAHDRVCDRLEAESVKYNVARIVRLSSGRFALFSHYCTGALDLIAVGTIEEIVDHIPSADECSYSVPREGVAKTKQAKLTTVDLADLGL